MLVKRIKKWKYKAALDKTSGRILFRYDTQTGLEVPFQGKMKYINMHRSAVIYTFSLRFLKCTKMKVFSYILLIFKFCLNGEKMRVKGGPKMNIFSTLEALLYLTCIFNIFSLGNSQSRWKQKSVCELSPCQTFLNDLLLIFFVWNKFQKS